MKTIRAVIGLFVITAGIWPSSAYALMQTTPTKISDVAPLMITSYQTQNKATDIAFLEIYNTSAELVRLDDWTIVDTANARNLVISTDIEDGYIEPRSHVVIAKQSVVAGATYRIDSWSQVATTPKTMTTLQLARANYRPHETVIATKTPDVWMMRGYLTSGYSSVTFETNYRQLYDDGLYIAPMLAPGLMVSEIYPYASDCSPFDTSALCGDYVKIVNTSDKPIDLDDMVLRTDSNSANRNDANTISLSGVVAPHEFVVVSQTDGGMKLSLTNSGGYVWFEDVWGVLRYENTLAHYQSATSAQQGSSYAYDAMATMWRWTTTPRPDRADNEITLPVEKVPDAIICPEGKYLNPETNRCRTIADAVNALTACEEGSERNPLTNRCRKITPAMTLASSLTPCKEGQERNPETNRCRSIASAVAELLPCDEGYERNPTTNRCRKIKTSDMPTMGYPVKQVGASTQTTMTWWALGGVGVLALMYAGWEWRSEVGRAVRRVAAIVRK